MSEPRPMVPVLGRAVAVLAAVGVLASGCSVKSIDSDLSEAIKACKGDEPCVRRATNDYRCFEWAEQTSKDPADCLRAVEENDR